MLTIFFPRKSQTVTKRFLPILVQKHNENNSIQYMITKSQTSIHVKIPNNSEKLNFSKSVTAGYTDDGKSAIPHILQVEE